jgi:hypothetical protein
MTDIVVRMRSDAYCDRTDEVGELLRDAADEIERLRAKLEVAEGINGKLKPDAEFYGRTLGRLLLVMKKVNQNADVMTDYHGLDVSEVLKAVGDEMHKAVQDD